MPRALFAEGCQVIIEIGGAIPQVGLVVGEPLSISGETFYRVDTGNYEALFPPQLLVPYLGPIDV